MDNKKYWCAFSKLTKAGPAFVNRLYKHFGSIELCWNAKEYDLFKATRDEVLKALELVRQEGLIKSNLEAEVEVKCLNEEVEALFNNFTQEELNLIFGVSRVNKGNGKVDFDHVSVEVRKHPGQRCDRCWQYFDELIEVEDSHVCPRCKKGIE